MSTAQVQAKNVPARQKDDYEFRVPTEFDGAAIWRLISECPPLDTNSMYCNLVQCSHFADTSIIAEQDGEPHGWVSGHLIPERPHTLFVWQVAVHEKGRGAGLGKRLILNLLDRPALKNVTHLETTITPDNAASWGLFKSVARALDAPIKDEAWFTKEDHFQGAHDTEHLVTIGPFGANGAA